MMEYADYIASWIRKIDKRLSGPADHGEDEALVESVVSVFSDIDGIKSGLDTYRGRVYFGGMSSDDCTDYRGDLEKLKGKLERHMVREGMQRAACSPSEAVQSDRKRVIELKCGCNGGIEFGSQRPRVNRSRCQTLRRREEDARSAPG